MVLAAARKPLEVEIVGGESEALHILLAVAGPCLIAAAAVIAAIVAARTANRRQQAQLSHDLDVRRLGHIRDALDVAVEAVHQALVAVSKAELDLDGLEASRRQEQRAAPDPEPAPEVHRELEDEQTPAEVETGKSFEAAHLKLVELISAMIKLKLRLGDEGAVVDSLDALHDAWSECLEALEQGAQSNRTARQLEEFERLDDEAGRAYGRFHQSCEALLNGSRFKSAESAERDD